MIDWSKATPEEFELRIEAEGIQESGNHIIFPVQVYHRGGAPTFLKSIPIRSEFYDALKKTTDWKTALMKIFRQRVRDDLAQRIKPQVVPVVDKIDLINTDKQSI
jgi:hypothetical protein